MQLNNNIWGQNEVNDSILISLLTSDAVKRLKQVMQAGANFLINPNRNVTRYEHSEGVMLLIKRLGGSWEEQAAGLLHDISHTAFSHTIDMLMNNKNDNYHETVKEKVVTHFGISEYFLNTPYQLDRILDEKNFLILDQPQPNLCADRIDYAVRDMKKLGYITQAEIEEFLDTLTVINGRIMVTDIESAEWFCIQFHRLVKNIFMDPTENYYSYLFTRILNYALEICCISMDDLLFGTDSGVLESLYKCDDSKLKDLLTTFEHRSPIIVDQKRYEIIVRPKARVIDPNVYINNKIGHLSSYSSLVGKLSAEICQIAENGLFLRTKRC